MKRTDHIYDVYTFAEQLSDAQCAEIMHEFLMGIMEYELRARLTKRLYLFLTTFEIVFFVLYSTFYAQEFLVKLLKSYEVNQNDFDKYMIWLSCLVSFACLVISPFIIAVSDFILGGLIRYLGSWVFEKFPPTLPYDIERCDSISRPHKATSQIFVRTFLSKFPNVFFQKFSQIQCVFLHIEERALLGNHLAHSERVFWARVSKGVRCATYRMSFDTLEYPLNLSDMRIKAPLITLTDHVVGLNLYEYDISR